MNPTTNLSAKAYTKKQVGKPKPPKSKAIVGTMNVNKLRAIDPSRMPVKAYTKMQGK